MEKERGSNKHLVLGFRIDPYEKLKETAQEVQSLYQVIWQVCQCSGA